MRQNDKIYLKSKQRDLMNMVVVVKKIIYFIYYQTLYRKNVLHGYSIYIFKKTNSRENSLKKKNAWKLIEREQI